MDNADGDAGELRKIGGTVAAGCASGPRLWERLSGQAIPDVMRDPGGGGDAGIVLSVQEILRCGTGCRRCLTQDDIMGEGTVKAQPSPAPLKRGAVA